MRTAALCLLLVPAAAAAPECKEYEAGLRRIDREQRAYEAKEMDADLRVALELLWKYFRDLGDPDASPILRYDLSGYDRVYERFAEFAKRRATLDREVAAGGGGAAAEALLRQLLSTAHEIAEEDRTIAKSRPLYKRFVHDQGPGARRFAAYLRLDALVEALGTLRDPEALAVLTGKAWDRARAADKRDGRDLARIAVIDALARTGAPGALPLLAAAAQEEEPRLRIAAIEGLARLPEERRALEDRLSAVCRDDPCFAVRMTALDELQALAPGPRVVEPLAKALPSRTSRIERARLRAVLVSAAGRDLGTDAAAWEEWFAQNREAIAQGTWKKEADQARTTASAPDEGTVSFFRIPTVSRRILLVLDAGEGSAFLPVDVDLAKTRNFRQWRGMGASSRTYVTKWGIICKEVAALLSELAADARVGLLVAHACAQVTFFHPDVMVKGGPRTAARVASYLDKLPISGWCAPLKGIWEAYRAAGCEPLGTEVADEPLADVIFIAGEGVPAIGEIANAAAVVDDLRRLHRFFRIPVHTVRLNGTEGGEVMEAMAKVSGGLHEWRKKP